MFNFKQCFLPVFPQFWTELEISFVHCCCFSGGTFVSETVDWNAKDSPSLAILRRDHAQVLWALAQLPPTQVIHLAPQLFWACWHRWWSDHWSSSTSIVLSLLTPMVVWSGSRWGNWERGSPRFRGSSPDFVRLSRLRYLHTITCTSTSRFVSGNCTQGFPTWQTSFTVYFSVYKLCASSLVLCFSSFSLSSSLSFFSSLFSFPYIYVRYLDWASFCFSLFLYFRIYLMEWFSLGRH